MAWQDVGRGLLPPILLPVLLRALGYRTRPLPPVVIDYLMACMQNVTPGWIREGNLEAFAYCLARLPSDAPIIEIGSFAGLSLNYLILLLRRADRQNPVFSVDPWKFGHGTAPLKGSDISYDAYSAHIREIFRRNITLFSGDRLPHHIELSSDAFFAAWAGSEKRIDFFGNAVQLGGPIAFAYIDGSHTYEQSTKDFQNVDRYLEPGGFIVFDDSEDYHNWGSTRTAQEAAMLERYEVVAKNPNYCLRKC
jgi:Methyltransferase domain